MSLGKLSKSKVQGLEASRKAAAGSKRLTLVRHAKSDWSLPGQEDWDRVLNKRGQQDAPEMARRLRSRKFKPDLILTSPAVRALSTASIMARELKVPAEHIAQDERLYLADPRQMLEVIHELGGQVEHLMVFGHNPGITEFANLLSAGERIDNLPTCGVFTACFRLDDWSQLASGQGTEAEFDYPRNLG
ncbi:MAG TPA: histidine phosphatase family protein [Steroidobacteraceae bacterium]